MDIVSLPNAGTMFSTAGDYTQGIITAFLPIIWVSMAFCAVIAMMLVLLYAWRDVLNLLKKAGSSVAGWISTAFGGSLGVHLFSSGSSVGSQLGSVTSAQTRAKIADIRYDLMKKGVLVNPKHDQEVLSKFPEGQRKFATSAGNIGQVVNESYSEWKEKNKT